MVIRVPIINNVVATGRRNGFWNLLTFSRKGITSKPKGIEAIAMTRLLGTVRRIGRRDTSTTLAEFQGGCRDLLVPQTWQGLRPRTTIHAPVPRITTGKMYSKSLGWFPIIIVTHALGKFSRNIGSLISGFFSALPSLTVLSFVSSV